MAHSDLLLSSICLFTVQTTNGSFQLFGILQQPQISSVSGMMHLYSRLLLFSFCFNAGGKLQPQNNSSQYCLFIFSSFCLSFLFLYFENPTFFGTTSKRLLDKNFPFTYTKNKTALKRSKTHQNCQDCWVFFFFFFFSVKIFPANHDRRCYVKIKMMSKSWWSVWCHVRRKLAVWEYSQEMHNTTNTRPSHTQSLQSSSFIRNTSPFFPPFLFFLSLSLSLSLPLFIFSPSLFHRTPSRGGHNERASERVSEWASEWVSEWGRAGGWSSVWSLSSRRLSPGVFGHGVYRWLTLGLLRNTGQKSKNPTG